MSYQDYKKAREGALSLKSLMRALSKQALRPSEKKILKELLAAGAFLKQKSAGLKRADRHLAEVLELLGDAILSGGSSNVERLPPRQEAAGSSPAPSSSKKPAIDYHGPLPTKHI